MSHKPTPYSPNFPPSQGYAPPLDGKIQEGNQPSPLPMPIPSSHMMPMPIAQNTQMQPGFQPGFQPGYASPGYLGFQPPITQQPTPHDSWMAMPHGLSNCPPGLEYLSMIDQLIVHQKVEAVELAINFERNNKYSIKNSIGQRVYHAVEDTDCCTRNLFGACRPFDMRIMDNFNNEVIHLRRPLACDSCCCPCWLQKMEITAPPGTVIGSIIQEWSLIKPYYSVKNATGEVVLKIKGPFCTFSLCGRNVDFHIYSKDEKTKVGKITKQWSGLAREVFTDADYFGIKFPMDLDVRVKAVLLGACFLIDFMFFEHSGRGG